MNIIRKVHETLPLSSSKRLLFIDAFGAFISAFLLAVVCPQWHELLGIPSVSLYLLASVPFVYMLADVFAIFQFKQHNSYLKGIAWANLTYCILSLLTGFYHHNEITIWGWTYILGEIIIICNLAIIELRVEKKIYK